MDRILLNPFVVWLYMVTATVTSSPTGTWSNETATVSTPGMGLVSSTANSKIIIDSPDDIMPIQSDTDSVRSSVIFFSASLSMFAAIGIIIFFRKCVNCPTRRHGRRRHYYPAGEAGAFRTVGAFSAGGGGSVVTAVETDTLDVTGLDATTIPLTPSPAKVATAASSDYDDEINSPTCSPRRHHPLLGLADSTAGFRFYDDDIDDNDQTGGT